MADSVKYAGLIFFCQFFEVNNDIDFWRIYTQSEICCLYTVQIEVEVYTFFAFAFLFTPPGWLIIHIDSKIA